MFTMTTTSNVSGNCQLNLRRCKARNAVVPDRRLVVVFKRTNGGSRYGPCGACSICALFTFIEIEDFEDNNPLLVPPPRAVSLLAQCLDDRKSHDVEQKETAAVTVTEHTQDGTVNVDADPGRANSYHAALPDAPTAPLVLHSTLAVSQSSKTADGGGADEHGSVSHFSAVDVDTDAQTETAAHVLGAPIPIVPLTHYRRRHVHNESDGSRWLSDTILIIKDYLIGQPWLPVLPTYLRRLLACRKREGCEAAKGFINGLINTGDWIEEQESSFVTESDGSVWYGKDVDTILDYLNDDLDIPILSDDIRRLLSARANEGCKVAEILIEDLLYRDDWDEDVAERGSWIAIRQSWASAQRRVAL